MLVAAKSIHWDALSNCVYSVSFTFCFQPPESLPQRKQNALLWQKCHLVKPDLDNLMKFYFDCARGIFFPDDALVSSTEKSRKIYTEKSQTFMKITKIPLANMSSSFEIVSSFKPSEIRELDIWLQELHQMALRCDDLSTESLTPDQIEMLACVISRLSEAMADKMQRIKKKYPGYWQDKATSPLTRLERASYSIGRPCC